MTAAVSWTGSRVVRVAVLAAGAPLTVVAIAYGDLRGGRWQARLASWGVSSLARALSLPVLATLLFVAWLQRIVGGAASLEYWWVLGLCVGAVGLATALIGTWLHAQLRPPPPPAPTMDGEV